MDHGVDGGVSKLGNTPRHHGVEARAYSLASWRRSIDTPCLFRWYSRVRSGQGSTLFASRNFERRGVSELHVEANSEGAWDSWGSSWDSECEDCLTINYEHALSRSGNRSAVHAFRDEAEVQSMRVPLAGCNHQLRGLAVLVKAQAQSLRTSSLRRRRLSSTLR